LSAATEGNIGKNLANVGRLDEFPSRFAFYGYHVARHAVATQKVDLGACEANALLDLIILL
jgi:hypothetical protein